MIYIYTPCLVTCHWCTLDGSPRVLLLWALYVSAASPIRDVTLAPSAASAAHTTSNDRNRPSSKL